GGPAFDRRSHLPSPRPGTAGPAPGHVGARRRRVAVESGAASGCGKPRLATRRRSTASEHGVGARLRGPAAAPAPESHGSEPGAGQGPMVGRGARLLVLEPLQGG